jgi:hypothetical protein
MIPLLVPSSGMAKDEEADSLTGGLTAKLLAAGWRWRRTHEKTTGMDVYTNIIDQSPARMTKRQN